MIEVCDFCGQQDGWQSWGQSQGGKGMKLGLEDVLGTLSAPIPQGFS